MARIAGVDLPQRQAGLDWIDLHLRNRPVRGRWRCWVRPGIETTVKVKDLTEDEVRRIRQLIQDERPGRG